MVIYKLIVISDKPCVDQMVKHMATFVKWRKNLVISRKKS